MFHVFHKTFTQFFLYNVLFHQSGFRLHLNQTYWSVSGNRVRRSQNNVRTAIALQIQYDGSILSSVPFFLCNVWTDFTGKLKQSCSTIRARSVNKAYRKCFVHSAIQATAQVLCVCNVITMFNI
jgi:hypothetical protein